MAKKKAGSDGVLAQLSVPIELGIAELSKSFQQVQKMLASFGRDLARMTASISKDFSRVGVQISKSLSSSFNSGTRAAVGMARESRMAFTSVLNNATKVSGQIAKTFQSAFRVFGRGGGGIGTGIFQGVGQSLYSSIEAGLTAPFRAFGQTISDAMSLEAIERKFSAVFKGIEADAGKFADNLAAKLGGSGTRNREIMSRVQDTLVPVGFGRKQASEMTKVLTQLSADLSVFESMDQTEVIDRIVSAMVGNHESVRRFGTMLSEVSINAKLMEMGIKGGSHAADEQQKMLARLQIILESTADAHGMAAKSGGSLQREWGNLTAILQELSGTIGRAFTPALAAISTMASKTATEIKNSFGDTKAIGERIGEAMAGVVERLEPWRKQFVDFAANIGEQFSSLGDYIADAFSGVNSIEQAFEAVGDRLADMAVDIGGRIGVKLAEAIGESSGLNDFIRNTMADFAAIRADFASGFAPGAGDRARQETLDSFKPQNRVKWSPEAIKRFGERGITIGADGQPMKDGKRVDLSQLKSWDDLNKTTEPTAPAAAGELTTPYKLPTEPTGGLFSGALGAWSGFGNALAGFGRQMMPGSESQAVLNALGSMMTPERLIPEQAMRPQVEFAGLADIQKQIQQQLGGDDESRKRELQIKILEEQRKIAGEQLDMMREAPAAFGKAVGDVIAKLNAIMA